MPKPRALSGISIRYVKGACEGAVLEMTTTMAWAWRNSRRKSCSDVRVRFAI